MQDKKQTSKLQTNQEIHFVLFGCQHLHLALDNYNRGVLETQSLANTFKHIVLLVES